jgi:alkylation response protein AidB-like acyl-CoA dehydrogenase
MDFSYTEHERAFRAELRAWLAANVPREAMPATLEGEAAFLTAWQRRLYDAGWVAVHWPRAYGGRGASLTETAIYQEEMARARAPQVMNRVGINNVGPTLIAHGTEAQRQRYLSGILSGEEIWCQLYSEPNAGSDLASLRCRADKRGDGFIVSGQKVWTSYAQFVAFGILLARTDPDAPPHRGISCFIVDMRSPGLTIRPLPSSPAAPSSADVLRRRRRAARQLVGAENDGWRVATVTLAHERGTNFSFKEQVLQKISLDELADQLRASGAARDPVVRQRWAASAIEVEIMRLHNCATMTRLARGELPGAESSIVKLFWADLSQRLNDLGLDTLGPAAQHADGPWPQRMLWSRCASIAGGTNEIQRNIIAQRLLGLPRN